MGGIVRVGEAGLAAEQSGDGWVALPDAIESLRSALAAAWWDGKQRRVRFKVEPVELTMQVGLTQTGKGAAGIHWHVLALGTERSRETASTQTLKLRLTPVLFDAYGNALDDAEQFISDAGDPE
jgi:hypothetical protein